MTHSFRLSIYFDFDRCHRFISEDTSVHQKMKTEFMQTANLLTTELQLRVKHLLLVTVCRHFLTCFQDLDFPPFQNNVGVVRGVDRILTAFRISRVNFRQNMWTFREDKGIYLSLTYGCSRSGVPLHNGIYDVNRKVRKCQHETVISVNNWYFKKFCYDLCMLSFQSQLLLTATEPWNNLHVYKILYLEVLTSYISVVTFLAFI